MTNLNDAQKEEVAQLLQLVARGVKVISKEQQELAWEYIPLLSDKHPKTCVCTGTCAQWATTRKIAYELPNGAKFYLEANKIPPVGAEKANV